MATVYGPSRSVLSSRPAAHDRSNSLAYLAVWQTQSDKRHDDIAVIEKFTLPDPSYYTRPGLKPYKETVAGLNHTSRRGETGWPSFVAYR
jgi:hypothetical protein